MPHARDKSSYRPDTVARYFRGERTVVRTLGLLFIRLRDLQCTIFHRIRNRSECTPLYRKLLYYSAPPNLYIVIRISYYIYTGRCRRPNVASGTRRGTYLDTARPFARPPVRPSARPPVCPPARPPARLSARAAASRKLL